MLTPSPLTLTASGMGVTVGVGEGVEVAVAGERYGLQADMIRARHSIGKTNRRLSWWENISQDYTN